MESGGECRFQIVDGQPGLLQLFLKFSWCKGFSIP